MPTVVSGPYGYGLGRPLVEHEERYVAKAAKADPRMAALAVGLATSNSFMLPTHQVNALYMGPGEYRTVDYIKIGGGLSLIYIVVLVSVTYFFYL